MLEIHFNQAIYKILSYIYNILVHSICHQSYSSHSNKQSKHIEYAFYTILYATIQVQAP